MISQVKHIQFRTWWPWCLCFILVMLFKELYIKLMAFISWFFDCRWYNLWSWSYCTYLAAINVSIMEPRLCKNWVQGKKEKKWERWLEWTCKNPKMVLSCNNISWVTPLLVFLNANRNNPQVHRITVVAFHPKVFRVSYFPQGTEVLF